MNFKQSFHILSILVLILSCQQSKNGISLEGLSEPVEIIRDEFGINHIYAKNQKDLFFAQGYAAAKDRLFQFEIWRRQATGTMAEILGKRALKRDHGTRLFKFRGDMTEEMNYYHEDGEEIITSYVAGVNAYIAEAMKTPDELPFSFKLLGITPKPWTPEVVISRHQGLLGNIGQELAIGRAVAAIGAEEVHKLSWFHPKKPLLELDAKINATSLSNDILGLYNAYRRPVKFQPEDLVLEEFAGSTSELTASFSPQSAEIDWTAIGSNNWVVRPEKMASGKALMANDPHRTIAVPSLRYMAHLVAPGWNVIGGGEPEIPGISIGHNEFGSWGLTVFRTDGEDLMVYDLNPENLNQYEYKGEWKDMEVISEEIMVKDDENVSVDLRYTLHGPVTFIDSANAIGYAVRCAWAEPGGSPYLASLRMDQAKNWDEFREACNYSHIPGENMIWAGVDGTIGWQSVGIAPLRRNFSGMVPVPGDGTYEWDGYLPIIEKPNVVNPPSGYFATANENVTPDTYENWDAIAFSWSDPFRGDRVQEVLEQEEKFTMEDMKALQTDYYSKAAEEIIPFLSELNFEESELEEARDQLATWDKMLTAKSTEATIYIEWENLLRAILKKEYYPESVQSFISPQLTKIIYWLNNPDELFGSDTKRDEFLKGTFKAAMERIKERLGPDPTNWEYGQAKNKHVLMKHPLSAALNDSLKAVYEVGPHPRGGNSYTVGSTGGAYNQPSGASFKMIIESGDWDGAIGTNTPGQSGDPSSKFYKNTFDTWAKDNYFPVYYSREKVESVMAEKTVLNPK